MISPFHQLIHVPQWVKEHKWNTNQDRQLYLSKKLAASKFYVTIYRKATLQLLSRAFKHCFNCHVAYSSWYIHVVLALFRRKFTNGQIVTNNTLCVYVRVWLCVCVCLPYYKCLSNDIANRSPSPPRALPTSNSEIGFIVLWGNLVNTWR